MEGSGVQRTLVLPKTWRSLSSAAVGQFSQTGTSGPFSFFLEGFRLHVNIHRWQKCGWILDWIPSWCCGLLILSFLVIPTIGNFLLGVIYPWGLLCILQPYSVLGVSPDTPRVFLHFTVKRLISACNYKRSVWHLALSNMPHSSLSLIGPAWEVMSFELSKLQLAKNLFLLPSSLTESISMLKNNLETKTASLLTGSANWHSDVQSSKRRHHLQLWITLPNTNTLFSVKAARVNTCTSWWHSRHWMSWHNPCRSPSQIRQKHRIWRQKHATYQCSPSRTLYSALVVSTKHTR